MQISRTRQQKTTLVSLASTPPLPPEGASTGALEAFKGPCPTSLYVPRLNGHILLDSTRHDVAARSAKIGAMSPFRRKNVAGRDLGARRARDSAFPSAFHREKAWPPPRSPSHSNTGNDLRGGIRVGYRPHAPLELKQLFFRRSGSQPWARKILEGGESPNGGTSLPPPGSLPEAQVMSYWSIVDRGSGRHAPSAGCWQRLMRTTRDARHSRSSSPAEGMRCVRCGEPCQVSETAPDTSSRSERLGPGQALYY
ncbi:hypothetical protein F5X68DRAFT_2455 [Plectosphaerella plurivora]|uniref:Uncharacterized protein n=1 Tax=Plectosphaerella plurivora TaxID=936078 RepID=A0A9P8VMF2_9PEZI|nr:hypothetical protein F5X68DRAFT_2455 [Plectosphaerella plurivora]